MLGACTPKQSRRFFSREAAAFCCIGFPQGGRLKLYFYIVSGAFTLNIVRMLWMTPRTAKQSAMRPC